MTMAQDGAQLALDWEVPSDIIQPDSPNDDEATAKQNIQHLILNGPIPRPVVIILHGINNDASFGYMKSLQRTYVKRGWVAACMNFRGCGGVEMTTPRGYNGAYTGDLRSVVQQISSRMMDVNAKADLTSTTPQPSYLKYIVHTTSSTRPSCMKKVKKEVEDIRRDGDGKR